MDSDFGFGSGFMNMPGSGSMNESDSGSGFMNESDSGSGFMNMSDSGSGFMNESDSGSSFMNMSDSGLMNDSDSGSGFMNGSGSRSGSDFRSNQSSVLCLNVTIFGDDIVEGMEAIIINFMPLNDQVVFAGPSKAQVQIVDDDGKFTYTVPEAILVLQPPLRAHSSARTTFSYDMIFISFLAILTNCRCSAYCSQPAKCDRGRETATLCDDSR